jgi:GrpB-like predicted nucleotidyltransferase (UPF0157 family)
MGQPTIANYDLRWPVLAMREKRAICRALGERIPALEHVGSTAVPELAARPFVDLMAGVPRLAEADACIELLRGLGYVYVPGAESELPDNRYLEKCVAGVERFHLHLNEYGSARWQDRLVFRDYLRAYPDAARQYELLKRDLAPRFTSGGPYSLAKSEFVRSILALARAEMPGFGRSLSLLVDRP